MINYISTIFCVLFLLFLPLAGCEDTNVMIATEAGIDAVKAVTLTDQAIQEIADQSSVYTDGKHQIARAGNSYANRLQRLAGEHFHEEGLNFNYKVYLANEVNAFAMANGTIRIYSGLMDMMDDDELLFVVGHEMGHVVKRHISKKIRMAYAASAIRKGVASQEGVIGEIARSQLGGLMEKLMGAQFSQLEEKEADDYGLSFLQRKGYNPHKSVSALEKLAALGNNHSFLSSHPAPGKRAERLRLQLAGKAQSIEDKKRTAVNRLREFLKEKLPSLYKIVNDFLPEVSASSSF